MVELLRHRESRFDVKFSRIVVATQDIYGPTSTAFIEDVREACRDTDIEVIEGLPQWKHLNFSLENGHSLLILGNSYRYATGQEGERSKFILFRPPELL